MRSHGIFPVCEYVMSISVKIFMGEYTPMIKETVVLDIQKRIVLYH